MIGGIKFENETKIGDLELNFCKNESEAYNTIVFAGENGCGKTAILEAIANFQKGGYLHGFSSVKEVLYFDDNGESHIIKRDEECIRYNRPEYISEEQWDDMYEFTEQDFYEERFDLSDKHPCDIRNRKVVFSDARSGLEVNLEVDTRKNYNEEEKYDKDGANYSGIVQLLIDLEEKDNEEYISYVKFHPKCTYEEYMSSNSRMTRFKNAYEDMFKNMHYLGIDPRKPGNMIYFLKGEQQIDITGLSTGEKQIVFRGTDILYHATEGATIIIDEPELSLHPKWQEKILGFYRKLFTDENGKQTAQLIIATHSQYVVQSAMADRDNVKVIILERENSKVKANAIEEAVLGTYSSAEINYLAFGVEKIEYHIQLYAALHNMLQDIPGSGVTGSIASIDNYIKKHACYDSLKHEKEDTSFNHYYTLPTYIRNAIDHPDEKRTYSEEELEISIKLLRKIYKAVKLNEIKK